VAAERRRDELVRILSTARAAEGMRLLDSLGLLEQLLPELSPARGCDQPVVHYYDVFDHSIETLAALDVLLFKDEPPPLRPPWFRESFLRLLGWPGLRAYLDERPANQTRLVLLKLAGLLHDVAKPDTKTFEASGRVRFFGHPELGATRAATICERLRFASREIAFVSKLVEEHLRPTQLSSGDLPTDRAVYRFFRDLEDAAPACLVLTLADASSAVGPGLRPERWQGHVAYTAYVLHKGLEARRVATIRPRLLTGHDIMAALEIDPGPLVGKLTAAVDEAAGTGEVATREAALSYARGLMREWDEEGARQK
jgi:tRNA nucleotidyltransferase/poly(A) polymerase